MTWLVWLRYLNFDSTVWLTTGNVLIIFYISFVFVSISLTQYIFCSIPISMYFDTFKLMNKSVDCIIKKDKKLIGFC